MTKPRESWLAVHFRSPSPTPTSLTTALTLSLSTAIDTRKDTLSIFLIFFTTRKIRLQIKESDYYDMTILD